MIIKSWFHLVARLIMIFIAISDTLSLLSLACLSDTCYHSLDITLVSTVLIAPLSYVTDSTAAVLISCCRWLHL